MVKTKVVDKTCINGTVFASIHHNQIKIYMYNSVIFMILTLSYVSS